jgi:hypothetical protein
MERKKKKNFLNQFDFSESQMSQSTRDIVLAVASFGIAATLLESGRTATFKLPLNLTTSVTPVSNILKTK